jgi:hypothetical protein
VQKVFENSLSLEREFALSVQRSRGLAKVPKTVKSSIIEEETGGRRSRGWEQELGRFSRENKDLREVAKRDFNPDRWIWKGTCQRSTHFGGRTLWRKFEERIPEELGKPK